MSKTAEDNSKTLEKWTPRFLLLGVKIKTDVNETEDFLGIVCKDELEVERFSKDFIKVRKFELTEK